MKDPNYIGKVLNFAKQIASYQSLIELRNVDGLEAKHDKSINKLAKLIRDIYGTNDSTGNLSEDNPGLINDAIDNFAKQFIRKNSMKNFSEKDLVERSILNL